MNDWKTSNREMGGWRLYLYFFTGLIFAVVLSQFPEFNQQYFQRLGGTLDELNRQVEALDDRAAATEMTRYDYVRNLTHSSDQAAQMEGMNLTDLLRRQFDVQEALTSMEQAPPEMLLITVIFHLDMDTAKATAEAYRPALPLSVEGVLYFSVGFIIGYSIMAFLMLLLPRKVLQSEF